MDFNKLKQMDETYIAGTYARAPVAFVEGKGARLYDSEGKEYIDFASGIGVSCLGYGDKDWAHAVAEQAKELAHASNLYYTMPAPRLAKALVEATGMKKVFFANSGAEANEGAIKAARKYSFDKYGPGRSDIVTLVNSFHGRTVTTLAATGQDVFHNYFFPFTGGFTYAPAGDAKAVCDAMTAGVCAIMMESIQGEGGVMPLEADFVAQVVAYAKERDILVIFDEVQTGVGRTGKFLGCQHFDVQPDLVTMAKGLGAGLPIGAVLFGEKVENTLGASHHGSTFGGNPVVAAGALVVMEKVTKPAFLDKVTQKGEYLRGLLEDANLPAIKAIRGRGLMIGLALEGVQAKEVCAKLLPMGLVTLTAGQNTLRLLPPLVAKTADLEEGAALIIKALQPEA